ncbi:MAG: tRNA (adenosine(37)-N6)-threonylcarbamoyltransferase complex ATPase subunit type 1 TsaE [Pseudomonadota bacterium]
MGEGTSGVWLADEAATLNFGAEVAQDMLARFDGCALVFLHGQLGAGKTTLVRGLLRALGHSGSVKSPTYTLLEPYELDALAVYHFDLYRVADPDELGFVGIDEIVDGDGLKLFEWADKAEGWLPAADVEITIEPHTNHAGIIGRKAHLRYGA